jgi:hydrogenase maturation protein HypF
MVLIKTRKLAKVSVRGLVQGVGFRPFVYRLAQEYGLKGWVLNTSGGVEIDVEGNENSLGDFLTDLEAKSPPMARIEAIEATFYPPEGYTDFHIRRSLSQEGKNQPVSPDIATCEECKREILNPNDRHFRYPFTNCTNCGPRFTIIEDIPYDRPNTTMRRFEMCHYCQQEYDDPLDRRFHAQPNACPACGPRLELVDHNGDPVKCDDIIKEAGNLLRRGAILALKGLGGFQLACDATDEKAINLLRARKRRQAKPLALMMRTSEEIEEHCLVSPEERKLLRSPECPIVLLWWKRDSSNICPAVAPNLDYLGVMLPYTSLHHLLLKESGLPLVMTSGNLSEEPIAKDNDEALRRLKGVADYFLLHNRDISSRYDDSVYMVEEGSCAIRRARGYAPYPIFLPLKSKQILACGSELKNTFCLTKDEHAFLSQHIGDMENEETLEHFESTIKLYKDLFRIEPEAIAYDMHPEYLSTKYALQVGAEQGLALVPVQHHHAHIVSCLVEHGMEGPVIGVALDGVGYGTDGAIWGGEFLLADWRSFRRVGQFEYVPLLGGVAAIKKPYRMALSYLYTLLGEAFPLEGLPLASIDPTELEVAKQQLRRKINSPLTSSAGRLFDAVSALAGVRQEIGYEAQAAIELEMLAPSAADDRGWEAYPFSIVEHEEIKVIKLAELFLMAVQDVQNRVPVSSISAKLHNAVAQMIVEMCKSITRETEITEVALSGGVFQNRLLLRLATAALEKEGFRVLAHHRVPCNDGAISLGQAVIANFALE